jgi:hypothetical protein
MIESGFIHLVSSKRNVASGTDAFNNATYTETTILTNEPCRLVEKERTFFRSETQEGSVISEFRLLIGDVNIIPDDILTITLEGGTVLSWKFRVVRMRQRRTIALHHKSAVLEVVQ